MAFPDYIVAIILSGLLGPGMFNLVFAIVMVKWVGYARLARSIVLSEKQRQRIMVMQHGRIVDTCEKQELFSENRHSYTKELLHVFES